MEGAVIQGVGAHFTKQRDTKVRIATNLKWLIYNQGGTWSIKQEHAIDAWEDTEPTNVTINVTDVDMVITHYYAQLQLVELV